jgi:hypothetical protein
MIYNEKINLNVLSLSFFSLSLSLLLYSSNINTTIECPSQTKNGLLMLEAALVIIDSSPILLEITSLLFYSSSAYLL